MFTVLIIMSAGILLGCLLRNEARLIKHVDRAVNIAIYLLLLLMGISVGSNPVIVSNLGSLGMKALLLALGAVTGSVGLSYLTYKMLFEARQ